MLNYKNLALFNTFRYYIKQVFYNAQWNWGFPKGNSPTDVNQAFKSAFLKIGNLKVCGEGVSASISAALT